MLDSVGDDTRGLRGILQRLREVTGDDPPISLAIILAGTNDVGYRAGAEAVMTALRGLHAAAHQCGVPTLAVGIPPSAFQVRDGVAAATVADVNRGMREWCAVEPMADYEPHPVDTYEPGGALWSVDGLHLSPEGYRATGEGLAAAVRRRLPSAAR
jgi:lysophospholipase L1-like esterase